MSTVAKLRAAGLVLAAVVYAVDQWVKNLMVHGIDLYRNGPVEIIPIFRLTWTQNYGVSLGMFQATSMEMRWALVGITGLIALAVLVWLLREKLWPDILGLSLILGGAAGNIHDRYTLGYVIDYADLHFGEFRPFMVFNIADAAISIGVVIILARALFMREKPAAQQGTDQADRSAETN